MSILSKITGIGINPIKGKIKIDPMKAAMTALTVGSMGGLGPLAGVAGKVGSVVSKIPGAAKLGGLVNTLGKSKIGQAARVLNGGKAITVKNTLEGAGKNIQKFGGGLLDKVGQNPLEYAAAGAAGVNAARAFKRAGDMSDKAIKTTEQSYNERSPLRKRGVDGMLKQTAQPAQDFSNAANPFAKRRKVALPLTGRGF